MERDTHDPAPLQDSDLLDFGSVSEETKGRFMQPFEKKKKKKKNDEAG